jgi:two-component system cell cycle sensor histidine kinase/response regulator CckA
MEAVGQLAGGIAHDVNNLLTPNRGYAELLVADLAAQDPRRDNAEQIVKAADSANSLTKQLLAFSRKLILAPTLVSLADSLRNMKKMLGPLIGENVELSVEFDADPWTVKADAGQIEQVVMNLVDNARDAMPTGGRIIIRTENVAAPGSTGRGPDTESVALTVRDTGVGMSPETVARIFEPFFTTKGEGRGTGLGLAMVDGIIEQSGGSLSVESSLGRGTCFRVLFPRFEGAPIVPDIVSLAEPRRAGETVLLVEDEAAVRRFARLALMREGYTVIEVARGDDALADAARHAGPIHLPLSDVVMPGMNGRELWEQLTGVRREAKALFMSGHTDDSEFRLGISDPGLPYLQKPFTVQSLAAAVSGALADGQAAAP